MDPKLSGLDPKLKEAYDRVMNGPTASPAAQSTTPPQPIVNSVPNFQNPMQNQPIATPNNPMPQPPINTVQNNPLPQAPINYSNPAVHATPPADPMNPSFNPNPAINSTIAFNANNDTKNQGTSAVKKSHNATLPVIIVVLIAILMVVYAFVWTVVFNVQLPFIPAL